MKINQKDYYLIISNYETLRQRFRFDFRSIIRHLVLIFDRIIQNGDQQIDPEFKESLIYSLISNEYKSEFRSFVSKVNWNSVLRQCSEDHHKNEKSLICLAEDNGLSYAIASQHILQYYNNSDKSVAKTLSSDTSLISDGKLAFDVMESNINDIIYGNHSNHMTNNSGLMFELEISGFLKTNGIPYSSEEQLRADSFDVTPDFKLNYPIVLKITKSGDNQTIVFTKSNDYMRQRFTEPTERSDENQYVVITWIECKAMFASVETHNQYYQKQYSSYVNRFGNGLVLYKLGFVSDIPQELKRNIVISDGFPKPFQSIE